MTLTLSSNKPLFPLRCVHVDLKGVPPTFERLLSLLDIFVAARYNAILVEWEDSFPWTIDLRLRSETAYTPQQIREFMQAAADKNLEVIPLVQCLGHMEMPLSLPQYASLREVPQRSDVLNVLAPGAGELVRQMIDEMLAVSPHIRYFHLGGDEAWTLGAHPDTAAFIERHGKDALYLQHIQPLMEHLAKRNIRPILWHDMMIHWPAECLAELATKADLMVWGYRGHPDLADPDCHHHRRHIDRLKQCGLNLWCAGAFKGGSQLDSDIPDFNARRENALAWAEIHQSVTFVGAVATGWSRGNTCSLQMFPWDSALDTLVDLGMIFYEGQPIPEGPEGCAAFLDTIGEGDRFRKCLHAMQELKQARYSAWENVIFLRQLLVTVEQDPRRQDGPDIGIRVHYLRQHLAEAHGAARLMREAFAGLIPEIWINRYLDERILPLDEEFEQLQKKCSDNQIKASLKNLRGIAPADSPVLTP